MTSPNPLVLSEALATTDASVPLGQRVHDLLAPMLDAQTYTAVGVIHGRSNSARKAYRRASVRLFGKRALLHLDIDAPLASLIGPRTDDIVQAFAEDPVKTMTFYAPFTKRTNWSLSPRSLMTGQIDGAYIAAGRDVIEAEQEQ